MTLTRDQYTAPQPAPDAREAAIAAHQTWFAKTGQSAWRFELSRAAWLAALAWKGACDD